MPNGSRLDQQVKEDDSKTVARRYIVIMEIKDIRQVLKANFGYDTFRPMTYKEYMDIIKHP